MQKITELTDQEIFNLTDDQVELMVKLRKAEEGIKLVEKPKQPSYFNVTEPDKTVYSCELFGDTLAFESVEELNTVITAIQNTSTKYCLEYDYNKAGSDKKFLKSELKHGYSSSSQWHTTTSQRAYSAELYAQMIDMIAQNKKMKESYEKEVKEYESAISEAKWVEDEIWDKVREVREHFWKLETYCRKFKYDYLPLSGENTEIAMNFMDKAYALNAAEKEYILVNYQSL